MKNSLHIALLLFAFSFSFYKTTGQQSKPELNSNVDNQEMRDYLLNSKQVVFDNQDSALSMLKYAEQYFAAFNAENKAIYFNTYGLYYWFTRDYEASINSLKQTLALNLTDEAIEYCVEAANNTGALYSKLGNQDSAIKYLNISIEIDLRRNNETGLAKCYYDLGLAYQRMGHYELALRNMLKSVDLNEKLQSKTSRIIGNYNVLGNLYSSLGDTTASLISFNKGLSLAEKKLDSINMSMIYGNISVMYQLHGNPTRSLYYARLSKNLLPEKHDDPDQKGVVLYNIAGSFLTLSQYDSAMHYVKKGRPLMNQIKIGHQAEAWLVVSETFLKHNMIDSAFVAANNSLAIVRAIQSPVIMAEVLGQFAKIDSAKYNYKAAFANYKRSKELYDSIHNKEHMQRIAELRIIYDSDKKETENTLLKTQNQLKEKMIMIQWYALFVVVILAFVLLYLLLHIKKSRKEIAGQKEIILQKNHELLDLNQTKDKFISIIAHDLKSPFNSLLGLLQDMIANFDKYDDEEKLSLLQGINYSSINTYNLLVNLLDWTLAQRNGFQNKPEEVVVKVAVEKVFRFLETRANQKKQQLIMNVDAAIIVHVDPDILSNILINLINNAIKFTPEGGIIAVGASNEDAFVKICIEDNGIGIPHDKLDRIFDLDSDFKRLGTSNEIGTGLGLVMVKEFVKISEGSITVQSVVNKGSIFCVELPVS